VRPDSVDTWRKQYNTDRSHRSLAMAYPTARFTPATGDALGLRIPAGMASPPVPDPDPVPGGTLLLRSDRLTPAELADEVLARAGLRQVHADGKRMRQARSPDSKET
jgi:hypothetical protein